MSETVDLEKLVYASALGDQAAFSRLYQATSARMLAVAMKILRNRSSAEEVVQEAFVQVWYAARDYRPDLGKPTTWMTTIVRNRAIDVYRKERRSPAGQSLDESPHELPDLKQRPEQGPELKALIDCMEPLSEEQRQSVLMTYYFGYSHGEISELLAKPLGTVKSWIRQALARVRECLE